MSQVLVLGNGESRKNFTFQNTTSKLIGCNAVHRDTIVDHLICCDRRMVEEAILNPATDNTKIYVRPEWFKYFRKIKKKKNICTVPDLPYTGVLKQDDPVHWGSGGYAVLLAATLEFEYITLIGFDLYPTNNLVNNLYKGTTNYSGADSRSIDYSFWVYQLAKVFKHYPENKFTIVNTSDWIMPREWQRDNVTFKNIEQAKVDYKYLC